jgi:hypothetical protein
MLHFAKRELGTLLCVIFTVLCRFSRLFMDVQCSLFLAWNYALVQHLPEVCLYDSFLFLLSSLHTLLYLVRPITIFLEVGTRTLARRSD